MGYAAKQKGYTCFDKVAQKVYIVIFKEQVFPYASPCDSTSTPAESVLPQICVPAWLSFSSSSGVLPATSTKLSPSPVMTVPLSPLPMSTPLVSNSLMSFDKTIPSLSSSSSDSPSVDTLSIPPSPSNNLELFVHLPNISATSYGLPPNSHAPTNTYSMTTRPKSGITKSKLCAFTIHRVVVLSKPKCY